MTRPWRDTTWADPRDLPDDWLAEVSLRSKGRPEPDEWLAEAFAEWCDRGKPGEEGQ